MPVAASMTLRRAAHSRDPAKRRCHLGAVAALPWTLVRTGVELLVLTSARKKRHGFIKFHMYCETGHDEALVGKCVAALDLLSETAPHLFARVRKHCRRIVLWDAARAEAWGYWNACILPARMVHEFSSAVTAAYLVHETTHLRIHSAHIWLAPQNRDRIELVCNREMVAFVDQLPPQQYPNKNAFLQHLSDEIV